MKVAVTGGSGQLGSLVLQRLIRNRKVKRIADLDMRPPMLVSRKLEYMQADVRDGDLVEDLIQGYDALIHLAFAVTVQLPREVFDAINVEGSKNVFRAAAAAGIRRVVYCSSSAAYGVVPTHPRPIVEDTPRILQQDFPYAAAKYRVEEFLDGFERSHPEMRIARLRPPVLIGKRFGSSLAGLFGKALDHGLLLAPSEAPMPIVWDEDVADAIVLAFEQEAHGAFIVGADEPLPPDRLAAATGLTLLRLPRRVLEATTGLVPILGVGESIDPAWQHHSDVEMVLSSARAREQLGWQPRCPTAADVVRRYLEVSPGRLDWRIALFMDLTRLGARLQPPEQEDDLGPAHLCLEGKGGGDFSLAVQDGRLANSRGVPRPPASIATLSVATWLDLLTGGTTFATAQLTGKVRIEGDTSAGFLIGAILTRLHQESARSGIRGQAVRVFTRWLTEGGLA